MTIPFQARSLFQSRAKETWPFQGTQGTRSHLGPEVAHVSSQANSWHAAYYDPRRTPHGAVARQIAFMVRRQTRRQPGMMSRHEASAHGLPKCGLHLH